MVPDVPIPDGAVEDGLVWLPRLLVALDLATSNGDARRRIEQGGVKLDDEPVTDPGLRGSPARTWSARSCRWEGAGSAVWPRSG